PPLGRRLQPRDYTHQRRFAGARRPDHRQQFAIGNAQTHRAQRAGAPAPGSVHLAHLVQYHLGHNQSLGGYPSPAPAANFAGPALPRWDRSSLPTLSGITPAIRSPWEATPAPPRARAAPVGTPRTTAPPRPCPTPRAAQARASTPRYPLAEVRKMTSVRTMT